MSKNGQEEQIYKPDAHIKATAIPENKCFWEFLVERMEQQQEVPAIKLPEFNDHQISRKNLKDRSVEWAKAFYAVGVTKGEVIPFYGLNSPDMAAAAGGLNLINAVPYFLRPGISETAIKTETKGCRIAVIFEPMMSTVQNFFSDFDMLIVVTVYDWLPQPLKSIVKHKAKSVSIQGNLISEKNFLKRGKQISDVTIMGIEHNSEDYAMITSSSGTTNRDINKGIIATNGSIIANLLQTANGEPEFHYGKYCLCRGGPFAFSTVINVLFLLPLYMGQTIISYLQPNAAQIVDDAIYSGSNVVMCTGPHWDFFFRKVQTMIDSGNIPDLSSLEMPVMGGCGVTPAKMIKWEALLKLCGCKVPVFCGYGLSEVFAVISVNTIRAQSEDFVKNDVISVGFPMPGVTVAILLEDGTILEDPKSTDRGELLISCKSMMAGYYNRPEETAKAFMHEKGTKWLRTGDLAHIDTDGRIYIWGRQSHNLTLNNGVTIHPSDITAELCKYPQIEDAIVFAEDHQLSLHLDTPCETDSLMSHVDSVLNSLSLDDSTTTTIHFYPDGFPFDALSTKTDYNGMKNKINHSE